MTEYPLPREAEPPCVDDPGLFFAPEWPTRGVPDADYRQLRTEQAEAAKAICRGCAWVQPCLDYALRFDDVAGIWAETDEVERGRLRNRLGIVAEQLSVGKVRVGRVAS